jgi:hypothetical protein
MQDQRTAERPETAPQLRDIPAAVLRAAAGELTYRPGLAAALIMEADRREAPAPEPPEYLSLDAELAADYAADAAEKLARELAAQARAVRTYAQGGAATLAVHGIDNGTRLVRDAAELLILIERSRHASDRAAREARDAADEADRAALGRRYAGSGADPAAVPPPGYGESRTAADDAPDGPADATEAESPAGWRAPDAEAER